MHKTYVMLVDIDDDKHIVTAHVYRAATGPANGSQSYQTAWNDAPAPSHRPEHGDKEWHEWVVQDLAGDDIMTYSSRNEAIGELMASLRDNFDDDSRYR